MFPDDRAVRCFRGGIIAEAVLRLDLPVVSMLVVICRHSNNAGDFDQFPVGDHITLGVGMAQAHKTTHAETDVAISFWPTLMRSRSRQSKVLDNEICGRDIPTKRPLQDTREGGETSCCLNCRGSKQITCPICFPHASHQRFIKASVVRGYGLNWLYWWWYYVAN